MRRSCELLPVSSSAGAWSYGGHIQLPGPSSGRPYPVQLLLPPRHVMTSCLSGFCMHLNLINFVLQKPWTPTTSLLDVWMTRLQHIYYILELFKVTFVHMKADTSSFLVKYRTAGDGWNRRPRQRESEQTLTPTTCVHIYKRIYKYTCVYLYVYVPYISKYCLRKVGRQRATSTWWPLTVAVFPLRET